MSTSAASEKPRKPEWWLIKLPERAHWSEDVQDATKEVYGVYAVDIALGVHICSLTPSAELWFIAMDYVEADWLHDPATPDAENAREELNETILSAGWAERQLVDYIDYSTLKRVLENEELCRKVELDEEYADSDDRVVREQLLDYIAANWGTGALMF